MIIDFHAHVFPENIARNAIDTLASRSKLTPYTDGTVKDTLYKMDKFGISAFVALGIATKPTQQGKINDFMESVAGDYPQGKIISFGTVHPDAENAVEEVQRIKNSSLKGIKLHPDYQNFFADDKKMDDIYQVISEAELPVIFHTGYDIGLGCPIHCTPLMIKNIANRFPRLIIISAHFGGYGIWNDAFELTANLENVYYDTAFPLGLDKNTAEKLIRKKGAEKILFASDCPWDSPRRVADFIDSLSISDKDKEFIFSENAKRVLKISNL